jgi:hypothetical protein
LPSSSVVTVVEADVVIELLPVSDCVELTELDPVLLALLEPVLDPVLDAVLEIDVETVPLTVLLAEDDTVDEALLDAVADAEVLAVLDAVDDTVLEPDIDTDELALVLADELAVLEPVFDSVLDALLDPEVVPVEDTLVLAVLDTLLLPVSDCVDVCVVDGDVTSQSQNVSLVWRSTISLIASANHPAHSSLSAYVNVASSATSFDESTTLSARYTTLDIELLTSAQPTVYTVPR